MEDKKPVSSDKWTEALYETLKLNNAYDKDYDTFYNDFYFCESVFTQSNNNWQIIYRENNTTK